MSLTHSLTGLIWAGLDSNLLQWTAFAAFSPKLKLPFYTKEQATRLDGITETRNASLEAIWFIYLPTPVYSLSVSVYSEFSLLLMSQDTQFWVIELEKEGKDAYQLDLFWIPCVGSNWLLRNSKEQVLMTFFPRNVSIMVSCHWLLPSLNHTLSKHYTNHWRDEKRKSAKQSSCPGLLDFWTSALQTLRN